MRVLSQARPRVVSCAPLLVVVLVVVVGGRVAWAAHPSAYDLSWWTVDAGGTTFTTAEGYTLGGTGGQPDAGVLVGAGYTLGGGFWCGDGGTRETRRVVLPLVLRH